jgi:hypothetical protein
MYQTKKNKIGITMTPKSVTKLMLIIGIVLVVVIIVLALGTDIFVANKGQNPSHAIPVNEVIANPQQYSSKQITIRGYFYQGEFAKGGGYMASVNVSLPIVEGSLANVGLLAMNYSGINITLDPTVLYDFTGVLTLKSANPYQNQATLFTVQEIQPE